jgi:hypothetical protein
MGKKARYLRDVAHGVFFNVLTGMLAIYLFLGIFLLFLPLEYAYRTLF